MMDHIVETGFAWVQANVANIRLAFAALPLLIIVLQLRLISLAAAVLVFGCAALVYRGVDDVTVSVLLLGLSGALFALEIGVLGRRTTGLSSLRRRVNLLERTAERLQVSLARSQPKLMLTRAPGKRPPQSGAGDGTDPKGGAEP
jgi:hypothetical protein